MAEELKDKLSDEVKAKFEELRKKIIKIKSVELTNIKNVNNGKIHFFDNGRPLHILGLYGQNGSGKTALINALNMVKYSMSGKRIPDSVIDLIPNDTIAKIEVIYEVLDEREISYTIEFSRANESDLKEENLTQEDNSNAKEISLKIISELLETKTLEKNSRKKILISYDSRLEDYPLVTKNLFPKNKVNSTKLDYVKAMSLKGQESFIFGMGMRKFLKEYEGKGSLDELKEVWNVLSVNFQRNLIVYSNDLSGMIYTNIVLPISFYIGITTNTSATGTMPLPTDGTSIISKKHFELAELVFEQINGVLPNVIPGLNIEMEILEGNRKNDKGEEGYLVEVMAIKNGSKFPFRCESDGIKKIVSVLSTLIYVYNTPNAVVAIDEFDSGIYEYLLGEIVSVMSTGAKGLLIFTSHNLRALEVLKSSEIVFTTTNPENRYIKVSNLKNSNNLRSMYLRAIQLGGFSENIYAETDTFEIQSNFRRTYRKMQKKLREQTDEPREKSSTSDS